MNEQMQLLTVRRQPLQPEPKVPSKVIKAYVKENMRGFSRRQAAREQIRQQYRDNETKRTPRAKQEHSFVKTIPITYRAVFENPTGPLNPMGLNVPGPQPVEVFHKKTHWYARELSTPYRRVFERLGSYTNPEAAKHHVSHSFLKMLEPWQTWGTPPSAAGERILLSHEFQEIGGGKAGWYTPKDRLHIMHGNASMETIAACGAKVPAKYFVDKRANIEPSCPGCAEVWKKEYKDK